MQQQSMRGKFKVAKIVTLPLFKWKNDEERYYQFLEAMYVGKVVDNKSKKEGEKKKDPATLAKVINLETGEMGQIICGKVLQGILNEDYPEHNYVGKSFAITQYRTPEKDYNYYNIYEIEPDEAQVDAPAGEASKKAKK